MSTARVGESCAAWAGRFRHYNEDRSGNRGYQHTISVLRGSILYRDCRNLKLLLIRYLSRHIWLRSTTMARQRPKVAAQMLSMKPAFISSIEVLRVGSFFVYIYMLHPVGGLLPSIDGRVIHGW